MDWAEKDAVTDARAAAGPSSDAEALAAMRDVWTHEGRGNPLTGKNLLRERLQPRAVAIAMGR